MRRNFLFTGLLLGLLLLTPPAFAISFSMVEEDQQQLIQDGAVIFGFERNQEQMAQVFTVGTSGFLTTVRLPIHGQGDLLLEIQRVTDGLPDGKVLTSVTFNDLFIPTAPLGSIPFQSFELSKPFHISSGNQFAIVLNSSFPDSFRGVIANGPVGDPYLGGDAFFLAEGMEDWTTFCFGGKCDFGFETLVGTPGRGGAGGSVPIPGTGLLFASGLLALAWWRRGYGA